MIGPLIVNFGGGTNSTALLVGLYERGIRPDLIVFADTGGEKPETYAYLNTLAAWLRRVGFPALTVTRWTRQDGTFTSLEEACLRDQTLPSIAYGFKGCSTKWKAQPVDKVVLTWARAQGIDSKVLPIRRALGIDAGEPRRVRESTDARFVFVYPLVDWGWTREVCVEAIQRAGLDLPGKSSCFFCPSTTRAEVVQLARRHPDLLDRALALESRAVAASRARGFGDGVPGLGKSHGRFNWGELVEAAEARGELSRAQEDAASLSFGSEDRDDLPCGCFDGD